MKQHWKLNSCPVSLVRKKLLAHSIDLSLFYSIQHHTFFNAIQELHLVFAHPYFLLFKLFQKHQIYWAQLQNVDVKNIPSSIFLSM